MIGKTFLKKRKTNFVKNGFVIERRVNRICDECGENQEVRYQSITIGRKRRGNDIDLCKSCSSLLKYKNSVFSKTMEQSVNWKGGLSEIGGYTRIYIGGGKRIFQHVQIYEDYYERKLIKDERLHHIDMDKLNNKIDNLYLCENNREHMLCHISSQDVALSFLNKKIWFDRKNKIYITEYICDNSKIKKIEVPKRYNIFIHTLKNKNGMRSFKYQKIRLGNGDYKYVHVYISEKILNRKLYAYECVHHIDIDSLNNDANNLIVLSRKAHRFAHISLQHCIANLYKRGIVKFSGGVYYV